MTDRQRQSPDNGIWLCETCSHIIDKNGGVDFSVYVLKFWKRVHEAEMFRTLGKTAVKPMFELSGIIQASGVGEITGADIQEPTRMAPDTKISATGIGKMTGVRVGGNTANYDNNYQEISNLGSQKKV